MIHSQRRTLIGFLCAAAAAFALLLLLFFLHLAPVSPITLNNTALLALPAAQQTAEDTLSVSVALPQAFEEALTLQFKTTHTCVDVAIDGESVYRFGFDDDAHFLKSPGTLHHFVDLPGQSAGKTLTFTLTAAYDGYFGNTLRVVYGGHSACVLYLVMSVTPIVLINFIIIFVGFVSLFLYVTARLRRSRKDFDTFLILGLFALSIAGWSLCQCGLFQFLTPDAATLYLIDFITFYLFPVPFNLFMAYVSSEKYSRGFRGLACVYLVNMAAALALQLTGIVDIFEILFITHAVMALNVAYTYFSVHKEISREQNEKIKRYRLPLDVVMIFAAAELVSYYVNALRNTSIFLPLGTITFIVMLVWIEVAQYYQTILEEQKMAYFKKLANTDMLTEVFNRNAYENTLKRLEQQEMELRTLCVTFFDVNNMKQINDDFGHELGDAALKCCVHSIQKAFGPGGTCFRIGGDEFVYLCNSVEQMHRGVQRFDTIIRENAKDFPFAFSVAMGSACFDPKTDSSLHDVIRRSDAQMYARKDVMKHKGDIAAQPLPTK